MAEDKKEGLETPVKIFIVIACLITAVPFIYMWVLSIPATTVLINMENQRESDITIKIIGSQWRWEYEYLNTDISFYSTSLNNDSSEKNEVQINKALVVPTGSKIKAHITSSDVIHAWWIPAFGVKKDAIPGYINELWFNIDEDKTGIYRGQCAELCGKDHAFMPIVVEVVTGEQFDRWVASGGKSYAITDDVTLLQKNQQAQSAMQRARC